MGRGSSIPGSAKQLKEASLQNHLQVSAASFSNQGNSTQLHNAHFMELQNILASSANCDHKMDSTLDMAHFDTSSQYYDATERNMAASFDT